MAIRISLHPYDFGRNRTYMFLIDDYEDGSRDWDLTWLKQTKGHEFTNQLLNVDFLDFNKVTNRVKMAFDVPGTTSNIICRMTNSEICSFREIRNQLSKKVSYKSAKLKHHISFLSNFKKIQFFTLPCSTFTCIASDENPRIEADIDLIYMMAALEAPYTIESQFIYKIEGQDCVSEFQSLPILE